MTSTSDVARKDSIAMLADFEFTFNQHDETIRRAESNARLMTEARDPSPRRPGSRPGRLAALRRRLVGSPAAA